MKAVNWPLVPIRGNMKHEIILEWGENKERKYKM